MTEERSMNVSIESNPDNGSMNDKNGKRTVIYLVFVFFITYIYEYICIIRFLDEHRDNTIASISMRLAAAMFIPAICVLITRLATGEGFGSLYIKPDLKNGKLRYYLLAWFLPSVLTVLGCIIYFACFRDNYSKDMEYIISTYAKQGISGLTPDMMMKSAISQGITAIIIGPVINCITTFGEEWGWRGYLLPKLSERFKPCMVMIIMGIIWGLWHLPLIIAGHNYGTEYSGYPFGGIAAMILFCFSTGTLLSYVSLKTGSCIPAVIGHGAINSFSAIGIYFTKDGGKLLFGPAPTGIIAGIPFFILAVVLIRLMVKDEEKQK